VTPLVIALIAVGAVAFVLWACGYVAGRDLPRKPTPFICWTCGQPHTDTTLCCHHCAPQEAAA